MQGQPRGIAALGHEGLGLGERRGVVRGRPEKAERLREIAHVPQLTMDRHRLGRV